jgi:hypothetical protein
MNERDWVQWHEPYEEPGSYLHRRLVEVRRVIDAGLRAAPPGDVTAISMCAGQGADLLGVLEGHPRRREVRALLVELDPDNAAIARSTADRLELDRVEVVTADAGTTAVYGGFVPARLVLVCGVFGNISDGDVQNTIGLLPTLCAAGATVVWTRHRLAPDLTGHIRHWFVEAGFAEQSFHAPDDTYFSVGVHQLVTDPQPYGDDDRLFTFVGH